MKKTQSCPPPVRRAALYIRVSTEEQAKKGYSIPAQREDLEEYARTNGYAVAGVFVDEGKSARKRYTARSAFMEMLEKVKAGEIQTHVLLGLNPGLINASGYSWTADYVTVTGDLCADLLSNIASEQRAKVVYEYLYRQIDDAKVRETIDFLLNREEAHNQMFRDAFNQVQDTGSNRDFGTTKAAKMYFSMSNPGPNAFAGKVVSAPKFTS